MGLFALLNHCALVILERMHVSWPLKVKSQFLVWPKLLHLCGVEFRCWRAFSIIVLIALGKVSSHWLHQLDVHLPNIALNDGVLGITATEEFHFEVIKGQQTRLELLGGLSPLVSEAWKLELCAAGWTIFGEVSFSLHLLGVLPHHIRHLCQILESALKATKILIGQATPLLVVVVNHDDLLALKW